MGEYRGKGTNGTHSPGFIIPPVCLWVLDNVHRWSSLWVVTFIHGCLFLLAGVHLCGQSSFMGHWYGVEVGHWWLVVVCPCGCLCHHVVVIAVFTIHPVMWHCHIAAVVVHVGCGGCEQSLMVGNSNGHW